MSIALECKKMKRTGYVPAFIIGGILAAVIPILNMAVRSQNYVGVTQRPIQILLDDNWQMMTMLNILLVIVGACIMYHTEYSDNAMQKMNTLPIKEIQIFSGKFLLLSLMSVVVLIIELISIGFCSMHWFHHNENLYVDLCKNFGYFVLLLLPTILLSLVISSAFKNMWISLGISVICVFIATLLPTQNFILSLFPFALPFQCLEGTAMNQVNDYIIATVIEIVVIGIGEFIFMKVRRSLE